MEASVFKRSFPTFWMFLLVIAGGVVSCKKNNTGGSGGSAQTLERYFAGTERYTLFDRALKKTHLDTLLGGSTPYTVFAPVDSAMTNAGYSAAGIDTADAGTLASILRYHLVPGTIDSADLQLYLEINVSTADSSYPAFLEYNNYGLFYDGIRVLNTDGKVVNGIVHGIGTMATPPVGDLVATIAAIPALKDFNYYLQINNGLYSRPSSFNFPNSLVAFATPASPITVFAPDNAYFASLGSDNFYMIRQLALSQTYNPTVLPVAEYYPLGEYFTCDLMGQNRLVAATNSGNGTDDLWFSTDGLSFMEFPQSNYGYSPIPAAHIVRSNIVATNGVIHIIELN
ncbi:MAG: fasciclin domain-containing protein [Chitinophagaceae bacterium]|nr:fasciclin domain-containing protein [Chitinophagaceae bacterium]